MQQWVFDTSLQKIANVIPTAAVKQSAKVLGPLVRYFANGHTHRQTQSKKPRHAKQWRGLIIVLRSGLQVNPIQIVISIEMWFPFLEFWWQPILYQQSNLKGIPPERNWGTFIEVHPHPVECRESKRDCLKLAKGAENFLKWVLASGKMGMSRRVYKNCIVIFLPLVFTVM